MKKLFALSLLTLACVSLLPISRARTAANDEAEIRQLLDRWGKAFRDKDINGIMSIYAPGDTLVAYDLVPPLQYVVTTSQCLRIWRQAKPRWTSSRDPP